MYMLHFLQYKVSLKVLLFQTEEGHKTAYLSNWTVLEFRATYILPLALLNFPHIRKCKSFMPFIFFTDIISAIKEEFAIEFNLLLCQPDKLISKFEIIYHILQSKNRWIVFAFYPFFLLSIQKTVNKECNIISEMLQLDPVFVTFLKYLNF